MPNHIKTVLTIECGNAEKWEKCDADIKKIIKKVDTSKKDEKKGSKFDFNAIIPMPKNIEDTFGESGFRPAWYDWSIENWGTKWNAYDIEFNGYDTWVFQTAWSHPVPIIQALSNKYPDLVFKVAYADENIGHNCAAYQMENGRIVLEYIPKEGFEAEMFAKVVRR